MLNTGVNEGYSRLRCKGTVRPAWPGATREGQDDPIDYRMEPKTSYKDRVL